MLFFFFNDTATTEIYTLSLHDALPICSAGAASDSAAARRPHTRAHQRPPWGQSPASREPTPGCCRGAGRRAEALRSEEHTSELQSRQYLVCRLLLEKKKFTPIPSSLHT